MTTDFNFGEGTPITTFDFGLIGPFQDFNFTDENLSSGESNYNFEFGEGVTIFGLFRGNNNTFTSIWCDPKASLKSGRFYAARGEDLTIVNYTDGQAYIEDYYSQTNMGEAEETLKSENIVDINVSV